MMLQSLWFYQNVACDVIPPHTDKQTHIPCLNGSVVQTKSPKELLKKAGMHVGCFVLLLVFAARFYDSVKIINALCHHTRQCLNVNTKSEAFCQNCERLPVFKSFFFVLFFLHVFLNST